MTTNKKAYYDYEILEEFDAGLVLEGWEAKAIASNVCSITGTHCVVRDGEVFLVGASMGGAENDQLRTRKLLLHKKEIDRVMGKTQERGLTLIPLKVYPMRGKFKLKIGLAKGKREYDKRETEKKRDIENEMRRIVKTQSLN